MATGCPEGAYYAHLRSFSASHCNRASRRTSFLRPMRIAGKGVVPGNFPAMAFETWAFET